jgi:outer membrane protein assembly factor BamD
MPVRYLLLILPLLLLSACGSTPDEGDDATDSMTAAELYQEAKAKLENQEYQSAIDFYEKLESRFPYGPYAERAQLEVIYAYYKYKENETAILSADRFIKLHPNHPDVDYAYYLRGLAAFKLDPSFLDRWFDQDMTERDPKSAHEAFKYFSELVNKFPHSRYTRDAIKRMHQLRNGLAKHEIHIANYYFKRGALVAAVNRAKNLVENYQRTPEIPDALSIMVRGYHELGLNKLADDALQVLERNFPEHPATREAKAAVAGAHS